jgi:two-component system sensor histidine kinase ChvG
VTISAYNTGSAIRVQVEDQGPGIPDENLGSIFERFYSERPDHEEFGNHSGLGLSISRQIIEAHGGTIWAENVRPPNKSDTPPLGARFIFELPT